MKKNNNLIRCSAALLCALALASCNLPGPPVPNTGLTSVPTLASQPVNEIACVVIDLAQVRSQPDVNAAPTAQMQRGTLVLALALTQDDQWYEVQFPVEPDALTPAPAGDATQVSPGSGWIAAEFLVLASEPGAASGLCPPPFPQGTSTPTPTATATGTLTTTASVTATFTLLAPTLPTDTPTPGVPEDTPTLLVLDTPTDTPTPGVPEDTPTLLVLEAPTLTITPTLLAFNTPTDTPNPVITQTPSGGSSLGTPDPIFVLPTFDLILPTVILIFPDP